MPRIDTKRSPRNSSHFKRQIDSCCLFLTKSSFSFSCVKPQGLSGQGHRFINMCKKVTEPWRLEKHRKPWLLFPSCEISKPLLSYFPVRNMCTFRERGWDVLSAAARWFPFRLLGTSDKSPAGHRPWHHGKCWIKTSLLCAKVMSGNRL